MARPKRYRLVFDFDSPEDLKSWSEGTEIRPYIIQEQDALHRMLEKRKALIRTFHIKAFADEDAPACLLYTSPSPRDVEESRMPSSA